MKTDNHFKENWEKVKTEREQMDPETDCRLYHNIQMRISALIKRKKRIYWAAAAVAIFLVGIIGISFLQGGNNNVLTTIKAENVIKVVSLPDGSEITLQPHTVIKVKKDFGKANRELEFIGSAIFKVSKNKDLPFHVNGDGFSVEVLGTVFKLNSTSGDKKVELKEGSVRVDYKGKTVILKPLENWEILADGNAKLYHDENKIINLNIENQNFEDIVKAIERYYNYKILYPKKYKDEKVAGTINGNLTQVLETITFPFSIKAIQYSEERKIVLVSGDSK